MTNVQSQSDQYRVFETDHAPPNYLKDEIEDYRALSAIENGIEGFTFKYLHVQKGSRIVFSVPVFYLYFKLSTMLNFRWLSSVVRNLGFQVACIGSPLSTFCRYEGELTAEVIKQILKYLEKNSPLIAFKGFQQRSDMIDFVKARSMPSAQMQFSADRWAALRKKRNLARKIKASKVFRSRVMSKLTSEEVDQVYALYLKTYEHSKMQFGQLAKSYFERSNSNSVFVMVYLENCLVGFAQLYTKGDAASTTFMGMDYSVNPKFGLYFYIYFAILGFAEQSKWTLIDFGETSYEFKKRIGCEIFECWVYYKHRNPHLNWFISKIKFLVEPAPADMK